jgi:hypothetical protein
LKRLAATLGRLPTRADVELLSRYELGCYDMAFNSWSGALKAARLVADEFRLLAVDKTDQLDRFDIFDAQEEGEQTNKGLIHRTGAGD